jgi:hypothetical protein
MSPKRSSGSNRRRRCKGPSRVKLTINHRFPETELVFSAYSGRRTSCNLPTGRKLVFNSRTEADCRIVSPHKRSTGKLMFKLHRENDVQSNEKTGSSKGTKCIHLFLIWWINGSTGDTFAGIHLFEDVKNSVWNKKKLKKIVGRYRPIRKKHGLIEKKCTMPGKKTLLARLNVNLKRNCYNLEMTISEINSEDLSSRIEWFETSIKDDVQESQCIDVNR